MSKRFRVSNALISKLDDLGISPAAVLRHAGLPVTLLDQPRFSVTTDEFFAFWRAIAELGGNHTLGLRLGSEDRIERYDPIAIAAVYARSLDEALDRMARYKRLTCPEDIVVRRTPKECRVQFHWLLAGEVEPAILVDLCFAWCLTIARRGLGGSLTPLRVELARSPADRKVLRDFFGCPVEFNAAGNTLVFQTADVERRFVTHNAELLAIVAPQLEKELNQQLDDQSLPEQVRTILKRRLAGQRPTIQDVARELNVSSRTLQRRLTEAESNFQQILEESRRELARHYLIHSELELNDTAYLLGYEDTNSFVRAFHSWEGVPPGHWRDTQRALA